MRELEEGVARLNDAGAPLLEAEDAQGCDSKGDALAHSKSSEKRGYSRRGATPAEKEADCASMWSAEADKYAIEQLEGGVPVSKLHEKLDEAGLKPLSEFGHNSVELGSRVWKLQNNSLVCHFDCIVQVEFRRHFSRIQNCYWLYSYVWC